MDHAWIRRTVTIALALVVLMSGAVGLAQEPVQHGAQPNPGEVRPANPQGNAPSEATGTLLPERAPLRVLGMPPGLAFGLAGLVILVAGLLLYARRRRGVRPSWR